MKKSHTRRKPHESHVSSSKRISGRQPETNVKVGSENQYETCPAEPNCPPKQALDAICMSDSTGDSSLRNILAIFLKIAIVALSLYLAYLSYTLSPSKIQIRDPLPRRHNNESNPQESELASFSNEELWRSLVEHKLDDICSADSEADYSRPNGIIATPSSFAPYDEEQSCWLSSIFDGDLRKNDFRSPTKQLNASHSRSHFTSVCEGNFSAVLTKIKNRNSSSMLSNNFPFIQHYICPNLSHRAFSLCPGKTRENVKGDSLLTLTPLAVELETEDRLICSSFLNGRKPPSTDGNRSFFSTLRRSVRSRVLHFRKYYRELFVAAEQWGARSNSYFSPRDTPNVMSSSLSSCGLWEGGLWSRKNCQSVPNNFWKHEGRLDSEDNLVHERRKLIESLAQSGTIFETLTATPHEWQANRNSSTVGTIGALYAIFADGIRGHESHTKKSSKIGGRSSNIEFLFIGDSLTRYSFCAVYAWLRNLMPQVGSECSKRNHSESDRISMAALHRHSDCDPARLNGVSFINLTVNVFLCESDSLKNLVANVRNFVEDMPRGDRASPSTASIRRAAGVGHNVSIGIAFFSSSYFGDDLASNVYYSSETGIEVLIGRYFQRLSRAYTPLPSLIFVGRGMWDAIRLSVGSVDARLYMRADQLASGVVWPHESNITSDERDAPIEPIPHNPELLQNSMITERSIAEGIVALNTLFPFAKIVLLGLQRVSPPKPSKHNLYTSCSAQNSESYWRPRIYNAARLYNGFAVSFSDKTGHMKRTRRPQALFYIDNNALAHSSSLRHYDKKDGVHIVHSQMGLLLLLAVVGDVGTKSDKSGSSASFTHSPPPLTQQELWRSLFIGSDPILDAQALSFDQATLHQLGDRIRVANNFPDSSRKLDLLVIGNATNVIPRYLGRKRMQIFAHSDSLADLFSEAAKLKLQSNHNRTEIIIPTIPRSEPALANEACFQVIQQYGAARDVRGGPSLTFIGSLLRSIPPFEDTHSEKRCTWNEVKGSDSLSVLEIAGKSKTDSSDSKFETRSIFNALSSFHVRDPHPTKVSDFHFSTPSAQKIGHLVSRAALARELQETTRKTAGCRYFPLLMSTAQHSPTFHLGRNESSSNANVVGFLQLCALQSQPAWIDIDLRVSRMAVPKKNYRELALFASQLERTLSYGFAENFKQQIACPLVKT